MSHNKEESHLFRIRHSLAHVLLMAIKHHFPHALPTIGPVTDNGFYYDIDFVDGVKIGAEDLKKVEDTMRDIIKRHLDFKVEKVTADQAHTLFSANPFKIELIDGIAKGDEEITIYHTGDDFFDLCEGPHVANTKEIPVDCFTLSHLAGAYWRGDENKPMLTRIYGLAFESKEELENYLKLKEEAEKRDHKKLGKQLGLFMFHETSPGMPYWLPRGLILYKELENYWRIEHAKLNYKEIASPLINKSELWKISGHWDHYKDDMFIADMGENEVYGIKPMNCPNAMVVFKSMQVSYRDLPLRLSDTDRLHRYERSGTLNGLFRCRSFQQDDSHNFITEEMIESEYESIMKICKEFYEIFNLEYSFRLGTRPTSYLGEISTWDKAESALKRVLEKSGKKYSVAEGDGAFYGPKIDIVMKDALNREWQMGTMQLDFQLPERFDLEYTDKDGTKKRPVVVHRVIYGSLERFIGVLTEHCAGNFPLWLSPNQITILPISDKHHEYAKTAHTTLLNADIRVELDESNETLGRKIKNVREMKTPYWAVIGDAEITNGTITLEHRTEGKIGEIKIEELVSKLREEIKNKK